MGNKFCFKTTTDPDSNNISLSNLYKLLQSADFDRLELIISNIERSASKNQSRTKMVCITKHLYHGNERLIILCMIP